MKSVKLSLELLESRDLLSIGTVHLTPGWATFGQAVPEGLAPQSLRLLDPQQNPIPTQTDVKVRWGDPAQSIRFAVVTVNAPAAGNYTVEAAAPNPGNFTPTLTSNFNVEFDIGGVTFATANPEPNNDLWLDGPLVKEFRQKVIPTAVGPGQHGFLRVFYDVTAYNPAVASGVRISVTVENTLNIAAAGPLPYTVRVCEGVCMDPNIRFIRENVTHGFGTRWVQSFDFFDLAESQVTPDVASLYNADALPRYATNVDDAPEYPLGPLYDILREGSLFWFMPDHGGRAEIAPYPDWAAKYLAHKDLTQKNFVLSHGDLAGSWPVHIRNAAGQMLAIDILERQNFLYRPCQSGPCENPVASEWQVALSAAEPAVTTTLALPVQTPTQSEIDVTSLGGFERVGIDSMGKPYGRAFYVRIDQEYLYVTRTDGNDEHTLWTVDRGQYGSTAATHAADAEVRLWRDLIPDIDHQPSLVYIPYLLTGRRYYADEMAFWADYELLATSPAGREIHGYLHPNETRGIAWGFRNLTDAAAYLPDGVPYFEGNVATKDYLIQKVNNNMLWFDGFAQDPPRQVLGVAWHRLDDNHLEGDPDGYHYNIMWQHNYVAWAIDHAKKQGFSNGLDWRDQIGQFQVNYLRDETYVLGSSCDEGARPCKMRDGATPSRIRLGIAGMPPDFFDHVKYTFIGQTDLTMASFGQDARLMAVLGLENNWDPDSFGYNFVNNIILEATIDNNYPRPGWAVARP